MKKEQLKQQGLQSFSTTITSAIFPPLGTLYLTLAPSMFDLGKKTYNSIKNALDIGDEVKDMIEKDFSEDHINSYLDYLRDK